MKITRRQLRKLISEAAEGVNEFIEMLIQAGEIAQAVALADPEELGVAIPYHWETLHDKQFLKDMTSASLLELAKQAELAGNIPMMRSVIDQSGELELAIEAGQILRSRLEQKATKEGHSDVWINDTEKELRPILEKNIVVQHNKLAKVLSKAFLAKLVSDDADESYGRDVFEFVRWHGKSYTVPVPRPMLLTFLRAYRRMNGLDDGDDAPIVRFWQNEFIDTGTYINDYVNSETFRLSKITEPDGTVTTPTYHWPRGAPSPSKRNEEYEDAMDMLDELVI